MHATLRNLRSSTLAALLLLAAACEGADPTGGTPPAGTPRSVASVQVAAGDGAILEGHARQVELVLRAADGAHLAPRPAEWWSSDTTVATVSSTGFVRAVRAGAATITARVEGKEGVAAIEVEARRVVRLTLSHATLGLGFMQSATVGATAAAQDGSHLPARVTWTTSDSLVATVDSTGKVTARGPGVASVKARVEGVVAEVYVTGAGPTVPGNWRLSIQGVEDGSTRCSVEGVYLALTANGVQVGGGSPAWSQPQVACQVIGTEGPFTSPHAPAGALGGTIQRASLSLWIGGWDLAGAFTSPDRVEGTAFYYGDEARITPRIGRFVLTRS